MHVCVCVCVSTVLDWSIHVPVLIPLVCTFTAWHPITLPFEHYTVSFEIHLCTFFDHFTLTHFWLWLQCTVFIATHVSTCPPWKVKDCTVSPRSELDLSKYVVNPNHVPPVYDLYAVINHYGGLGGGHCKCGCVDAVFVCQWVYCMSYRQSCLGTCIELYCHLFCMQTLRFARTKTLTNGTVLMTAMSQRLTQVMWWQVQQRLVSMSPKYFKPSQNP